MTEPTLTDFYTLKLRRGLEKDLPDVAPDGEPLLTTDTHRIFIGTGTGVVPLGGVTQHAVGRTIYNDTQGVYADGFPGTQDPQGRDGWYFANAAVGNKINWYFYDPSQFTTTVANLIGAYAILTTDTNRLPHFGVYTQITSSGNAAPWYKSRRVYSVASGPITAGTKYLVHFGVDPGVYPELPRIQLSHDPNNLVLNNGAFAPTETIFSITLGTGSTDGANTNRFVVHQLGFSTTTVAREYNLGLKLQATATYTQATAAATWTINHNLGKYPSVTIVDNAGQVVDGIVKYTSANSITCEFSPALAGRAYLN